MIDDVGIEVILGLNAALLAGSAALSWMLPNRVAGTKAAASSAGRSALVRAPMFPRMLAVAALIGGSHTLHDTFEVIRWQTAVLSATHSSFLWALLVVGETLVFVVIGPPLLAALGTSRAMLLAGVAGMIRWSTATATAWFPAMMLTEPLHGLTFAPLHLACMEVIGRVAPASMAAAAQTVYGTLAMGATTAAATLASGPLYERFAAGRSGQWRCCARSRFRSRREYGCPRTSGPGTKLVGAVSSDVSERQLSRAAS